MVEYGILYDGKIKSAIIYDTWDIPDRKHSIVAKVSEVRFDDVGKFLKLNDGSKQYVKILGVYKNRVNTSSGLYLTSDIICCVNPRLSGTEYCGAKRGEESFAIVPLREDENLIVKEILETGKSSMKKTKRIMSVTTEEIKQHIIAKGYNEQSVIDKTLELAFGKTNQHTINALKAIDKVLSTNMYNEEKVDNAQLSLASRFGLANIRNKRMELAEVVPNEST